MRSNAKVADVLFWALQCAIRDRESMADCYDRRGPEAEEALKDVAMFKALSVRICGTSRSKLDQIIADAKTVTIHELLKQEKV